MAERTDERVREDPGLDPEEFEGLLETGPDEASADRSTRDRESSADTSRVSGLRTRLRSAAGTVVSRPLGSLRARLGGLFSLRTFGTALVASVLASFAAAFVIPFVDTLGALAGIFLVAFGFGLTGDRRQYLEVGLAGAATAALGALTEFLVVALAGRSDLLLVFGVGSGLLVAVLGHYVGRDLRAGLTRDI